MIHPEPPAISKEDNELFKAFGWLKNYNVFPDAGGWTEQTAKFINVVTYCDLTISKMNELRKQRNQENETKAKLLRQGFK